MAVTLNANTSTGFIATSDTSGVLQLQTGGTTAVTVDASGNLQIGTTTSSGANITVFGSSEARTIYQNSTSGTGAGNGFYVGTSGADALVYHYENGPLLFATNSAERMRIDSAGLLCIGTTSAYATNSKVSINVTNATGHGMTFRPDLAASYRAVNFNNSTGSANVGFIDCTTSATIYSTSSDYRLKHDITPMSGALAKVGLLKPVTYKWNLDDSESQGFIAHELQAVVPECVTGEKDAVETYTDEDGNEQTRPVYQGIDTSFLVATLTAAIQEQQAIIQTLTDRITALEGTTP